jgi:hypothetical protein
VVPLKLKVDVLNGVVKFGLPVGDLVDMRRNIKLVLLRNVLDFERILRGRSGFASHIGQLHQIILCPVLLGLFHYESRLAELRTLVVARVVLPPLFVLLVAELGKLLAVNADDNCSVLLREILNVCVLPRLVDVSLDFARNTLWFVSLPKEGTLAVFESCLGVLEMANQGL